MNWMRLLTEAAYYLLVALATIACAAIIYTLANLHE